MAIRPLPNALASAALTVAAGAAHANLLVNGGFEQPTVQSPWEHVGGSDLTGWQISDPLAPIVVFTPTYYPVTEGAQGAQIEIANESISQTFATIPGLGYLLTFDYSAYSDLNKAFLAVSVGPATVTYQNTESQLVPPSWMHEVLPFVANASSTTLIFSNAGAQGWSFPQLDNVTVVAVPEPEIYALMVAGIGLLATSARRRVRAT
jgi:hypothetical protein